MRLTNPATPGRRNSSNGGRGTNSLARGSHLVMSEVSVTKGVPMAAAEAVVSEPFDTFYHREFAGLIRLAMVLVDSQEQAEEVVQDAFAALYLRYQTIARPLAYIRASVLNGSRKVLRRRVLPRLAPAHPRADSEMVYNHVIDAVRRLPARQRAA